MFENSWTVFFPFVQTLSICTSIDIRLRLMVSVHKLMTNYYNVQEISNKFEIKINYNFYWIKERKYQNSLKLS
jgi:hypothetical protein